MRRFLRENWAYIFGPIIILALLFLAMLILGGGDDSGLFSYDIW